MFSALPLCFFLSFSPPSVPSTNALIPLTLYALTNPTYIPLSIRFNLFCIHPYPSFISTASHTLFLVWPFISLHFTLFIPLCMHVCVCVAAGCLWLFFRQQPRRLDCHNLWSWVISVSNPNQGTGPFFLSSSTSTILFLFQALPPSLFYNHVSLFPPIPCHSASSSIFCTDHNSNTCYWSPPSDSWIHVISCGPRAELKSTLAILQHLKRYHMHMHIKVNHCMCYLSYISTCVCWLVCL